MNKYFVKIPYQYSRFGTLSCFVYASDSEEAEDLAMSYDNRVSEDFDDSSPGNAADAQGPLARVAANQAIADYQAALDQAPAAWVAGPMGFRAVAPL